jgi:hypothetical protein
MRNKLNMAPGGLTQCTSTLHGTNLDERGHRTNAAQAPKSLSFFFLRTQKSDSNLSQYSSVQYISHKQIFPSLEGPQSSSQIVFPIFPVMPIRVSPPLSIMAGGKKQKMPKKKKKKQKKKQKEEEVEH